MSLTDTETWQNVRMILLYPFLVTFGMAYVALFWARWRSSKCAGDRWSVRLGLALIVWGVSGFVALRIASASGFGLTTTIVFTIGVLTPAVVLVWGTLEVGFDTLRRR